MFYFKLKLLSDLRAEYVASCSEGRNRFVIDSNGDVYGCELLTDEKFKEGNVKKGKLSELWEKVL